MTFNFHLHVAIGLLVFFSGLQSGSAQTVPALRPRTANEVVAHFEKMTSDLKVVLPEEVQHPEKFSPARVDSVLGGLERIAETATSHFLSTSATAVLMDAGAAQKAPPGIFDRQMRLYRRTREVRALIVDFMPQQKDRIRALAFLKSVASQSGAQRDYENAPSRAVESLALMGNDGRAALIELRDKGLLHDPQARSYAIWFLNQKVARRPAR